MSLDVFKPAVFIQIMNPANEAFICSEDLRLYMSPFR